MSMTLLNATALAIDFIRERAPEDKLMQQAMRRLEKRLAVLQVRQNLAIRRRQRRAWHELIFYYQTCPGCNSDWIFGEFIKVAEIDGRGHLVRFDCPVCSKMVCCDHVGLLVTVNHKSRDYPTYVACNHWHPDGEKPPPLGTIKSLPRTAKSA